MSLVERRGGSFGVPRILLVVVLCLYFIAVPTEAETGEAIIEFEITERIDLTGDGNSCDLKAEPAAIEIINTGKRIISVDNIMASADNGWTLVEQGCDFKKLDVDSKKISITANGTFDLMDKYYPGLEIAAEEQTAILITAKTGPVTNLIEEDHAANIIITLKDMGPDMSKTVIYKYPTVDFVGSEETFDHSLADVGITRTFIGADSIKLVFSKDMHVYPYGGQHTILVMDKDYNVPYDKNFVSNEIIVPGDTVFLGVNLVNPGGRGSRIEDIPNMEEFQFIVTFIPLDENGEEMILTEGAIVYDEDMLIVPLEVDNNNE